MWWRLFDFWFTLTLDLVLTLTRGPSIWVTWEFNKRYVIEGDLVQFISIMITDFTQQYLWTEFMHVKHKGIFLLNYTSLLKATLHFSFSSFVLIRTLDWWVIWMHRVSDFLSTVVVYSEHNINLLNNEASCMVAFFCPLHARGINIQHTYANMRLIYVNMQHI